MRSTPVFPLEERLAAHLEVWTASHPTVAELAVGAPVLDGLDAVTAWGQEEAAAGGEPEALLVGEPLAGRRDLLPEACLEGVTDVEALWWAELVPGPELVEAIEDLWAQVADDVVGACRPVVDDAPEDDSPDEDLADDDRPDDDTPDDDAPDDDRPDDDTPDAVPDGVLLEAVAACERQLAALTARRDALAGVFAARREAEAEQDVADARAATAADGVGRPWATRARSTGPSELAARLGIGDSAADAMTERGLAAIGPQRDVAEAMAAGALGAATGAWLLGELAAVHGTSFAGALEREVAAREESLAAQRAQEDAAGGPALTRAELRARAAADRERVEAEAAVAAQEHAEQVTDQVRRELLGRATGSEDWPSDGSPDGANALARLDEADDDAPAPTSRPTAGAGLGPTRRTWKRRLSLAVRRADEAAAEVRAAKARAACSTQRWNEDDDQAALLLRGPAEVIAQITAAMDARARRRQSDARTAERSAAAEEGRRFNGSAVGTLDQHRIAALAEWATAALEISETSGVSGTWYPIARTAASKPSVSLVLPWTVLAGVSSVGAELAGYGPVGAAAALRIAADGLWRRVFADPTTGAAVGVEEGAWRPGTSLAKLVALRWPGSTLPGSTRPVGLGSGAGSTGGQLDHVEPWATDAEGRPCGGPTEATNLQLLAQVEHLLKQAGEHARPGHGWTVTVDRTGSAADDGSPPAPAPGDGVVWTSPTGHTYRGAPQRLLDAPPDLDDAGGPGGRTPGGLLPWVHRLLADVLPTWIGWPGDGPAPRRTEPPSWPVDWANAVFADDPHDPSVDDEDDDGGDDPGRWFLFDDLPAAGRGRADEPSSSTGLGSGSDGPVDKCSTRSASSARV